MQTFCTYLSAKSTFKNNKNLLGRDWPGYKPLKHKNKE